MADIDFKQFLKSRSDASLCWVRGDANPLLEMTTQSAPATFFGPQGGTVEGAKAVRESYERGAAMFQPESETTFEILHQGSDGDLGYWTGIQTAVVSMAGAPKPVPMKLRITEIFRKESGAWNLIHRHADPLVELQQKP